VRDSNAIAHAVASATRKNCWFIAGSFY